jgi:hypothetical protein
MSKPALTTAPLALPAEGDADVVGISQPPMPLHTQSPTLLLIGVAIRLLLVDVARALDTIGTFVAPSTTTTPCVVKVLAVETDACRATLPTEAEKWSSLQRRLQ